MQRLNRIPRIPHGCDQQGRHPEADERYRQCQGDDLPDPPMEEGDGWRLLGLFVGSWFVCGLVALSIVSVIALAAAALPH